MKTDYLHREMKVISFMMIIPFLAMLSGCSKSPDDLYREGMVLIKTDRTLKKGLKTLRKFEQKFPDDSRTPGVVLTYALANQTIRSFDEAIDTYNRIIEKYPGTDEAYKSKFLLGYLYYEELNDIDRAASIFEEFLNEYPDSELSASAEIILQNIDVPFEEWPIMEKFGIEMGAPAE